MRYQLRCPNLEGEVKLSSREGYEYLASINTEEKTWEREIFVSPGLIQVREEDGSLRNLAFTADVSGPAATKFFYQGRVRAVQAVGGVGGRVEGAQSQGAVVAPMNGQVVKVPVKIGERVECGDIVLILEAMKMENEVTAPIAGTLVELSVAPGNTVSPGQPMFLIESTE